MAKSKKVNPRQRPASMADVKAAYGLGRKEAIEFAIAVACLSVNDVFSPSEEQMSEFHDKYTANVHAILDGTIKYKDVLATLKIDYDLEVEFR